MQNMMFLCKIAHNEGLNKRNAHRKTAMRELYLYYILYYFFWRRMTCSSNITVTTPITKPLPMIGRNIAGITDIGIIPKTSATITGRPTIRHSSKLRAESDVASILNDAASCVPIR